MDLRPLRTQKKKKTAARARRMRERAWRGRRHSFRNACMRTYRMCLLHTARVGEPSGFMRELVLKQQQASAKRHESTGFMLTYADVCYMWWCCSRRALNRRASTNALAVLSIR